MILFAYLDEYADLFKDTLEELLEALESGYGTSSKVEIIFYARKNKILLIYDFIIVKIKRKLFINSRVVSYFNGVEYSSVTSYNKVKQ